MYAQHAERGRDRQQDLLAGARRHALGEQVVAARRARRRADRAGRAAVAAQSAAEDAARSDYALAGN